MTYRLTDREFQAVSALPDRKRYAHFIKRVADWEQVWGLHGVGGWRMVAGPDERAAMPVWPHERYAAACADGPDAPDQPQAIALSDWMAKWLPGMQRDGLLVAIFPTPDWHSVGVPPERLQEDLQLELRNYE